MKGWCCTVKHTPTLPCRTLSSSAERIILQSTLGQPEKQEVGNRMGTGMEIGNRNCEREFVQKAAWAETR